MATGTYQREAYMEEIKSFTQDVIYNVNESNVIALKADQKVYGIVQNAKKEK